MQLVNIQCNMNKKIFKAVESTLKKSELHYQIEDDIMFRFGISGDHANFDIRLICEEKMEILLSIVSCSMCVPKDKIEKMCKWIVEKNYSLTLGEFKMDTKDGELSFRLACPLDGGAVNEDIVGVAISYTLNTFDNTYEEIIKALYMDNNDTDDWLSKMAREAARQVKEVYDDSDNGITKRMNS